MEDRGLVMTRTYVRTACRTDRQAARPRLGEFLPSWRSTRQRPAATASDTVFQRDPHPRLQGVQRAVRPVRAAGARKHAESRGFEAAGVSDHLQPWRHNGGHAPAVLSWLGAAAATTCTITLGTSVLTPTMRYHPAIVAQAFATLGCLAPGRIFLGVGTGEAMNETPITGGEFPGRKERRLKMAEAIKVIKQLWAEERVDFEGDYYKLRRATIYDRPDEPVPIYVAASGPLAAKLAGRVGTASSAPPARTRSSTSTCSRTSRQAPRRPAATTSDQAHDRGQGLLRPRRRSRAQGLRWWAALALTPEEKEGVEDPVEMERLADNALDRAHTRFIVSDDPQEIVEKIKPYTDLGFTELVFHFPATTSGATSTSSPTTSCRCSMTSSRSSTSASGRWSRRRRSSITSTTAAAGPRVPAYFPAHRALVWSDIPNHRILRYDEARGNVTEFRNPAGTRTATRRLARAGWSAASTATGASPAPSTTARSRCSPTPTRASG